MITGIIGLMNSGKTLVMSRCLLGHWLQGMQLITNYDINLPKANIVDQDFLLYLGRTQPVLDNVALGFDELWIWLDARTHAKKENQVPTYFFNQSSKDDTPIYFTAQHLDQVDKRLRKNLQKVLQCSRVLYVNKKMNPIDENRRILSPELQKLLYIKVIEFKRVNMGKYTDLIPLKPYYIKADMFFRLYDTRQKIKQVAI